MSEAVAATPDARPKPATQRFRRSYQAVISTPDQRRREATVMRLAWDALSSRERVMAFLNGHADALGGRPLQLASDSDAGLARVAALLTEQTAIAGDDAHAGIHAADG